MSQPAGIRNWWLHPARRLAQTLRRDPRWLLRRQEQKKRQLSQICRQGRKRFYGKGFVALVQETSRRRTRRLSVCRSSVETWRGIGAANHSVCDEEKSLAES